MQILLLPNPAFCGWKEAGVPALSTQDGKNHPEPEAMMGHHPVLYAAVPVLIPALNGLPKTCYKISMDAPAPQSLMFNMYHG